MITDINPSGGDAGVASASLMYSINGGDFVEAAMTDDGGDMFSGGLCFRVVQSAAFQQSV
jgi:hypothetical protein